MKKAEGKITHTVSFDYSVLYFRDGELLDAPPDEIEARADVAREAVTQAQALFSLIGLVDARELAGLCENYPESARQMFETVASVGFEMLNEAFSAVAEISDLREKDGGAE